MRHSRHLASPVAWQMSIYRLPALGDPIDTICRASYLLPQAPKVALHPRPTIPVTISGSQASLISVCFLWYFKEFLLQLRKGVRRKWE